VLRPSEDATGTDLHRQQGRVLTDHTELAVLLGPMGAVPLPTVGATLELGTVWGKWWWRPPLRLFLVGGQLVGSVVALPVLRRISSTFVVSWSC
jgi:hypothetical protein